MARIAFIGLGDMGQVIVPRLLEAGHEVTGWNRSPGKADHLVLQGMRVAASPREASETADVVLSIVTDASAVRDVALGPEGILEGLSPEAVYLDMSTISPEASREVSAAFARAGRVMLDAPLSGSPVTVAAGKASVMVAGDRPAYERVRETLLDIGPTVSYIGPSGTAVQAKLSVNLLLMVEVIAFGEAVALAEKGGVEREAIVDAILHSVAASPVLGYRGPFVLEGQMPDKPLADVTLQQKDMTLVLEQGRLLGMPLPLASSANDMMNACRGMGIDRNDFVVAHRAYRRMGGLQ
ncbi:MAG: NAD(P)-dependent oxidoreductase [Candidatus Nanopelagicales bacterium]|jgi:3-hydroxyisobutyrate dehydrogenase-like beta-hydroxyacid dehydrogenase